MTNAIVLQPYSGLEMAMSPAEAGRRWLELKAFVQEVMIEGTDYGKSFATQPQPSLWQQGAQKLAELYGFSHRFEWVEVVKDWERMFFYFEIKCTLKSRRTGEDVGEGIGSCNSKESKYAYRWAFKNDVPPTVDITKLLRKERTGKSGKPYSVYRVDNDDMGSQVNTLQKMAAKRAYVHAVISVTRSSGLFTQDAEDLPEEAFGVVDDERSWEKGADAIEQAIMAKDAKVAPSTVTETKPTEVAPATAPAKIEVKIPAPAAKTAPKAKPALADVPFGNPEQERVGQKELARPAESTGQASIPTGPLPALQGDPIKPGHDATKAPDWQAESDKIKSWIAEAYNQPEAGPRNTVTGLVKRFCEGPPFPPAAIAEDLKRALKVMGGKS